MTKITKNIICSIIAAGIIVGLGLFPAIPAGATDYNSYSLDELNQMRGTMTAASPEDREAFRSARQTKMQALTPEERSSYQSYGQQKSGNANGKHTQARDGSGSRHRYQNYGSSGGGRMGSGSQHRGGRR